MSPAYVPEVAADYFSELESALLAAPDYGRVYTIFNRVFHRCLDQKAATTQLNLVGTFAKTDYLLGMKENVIVGHKIPAGTGLREYEDLIVGSRDEYEELQAKAEN